ncbi:MAG: thioester reductase domain-containing protein [Spirochaetales bacterium]|nr:thioester reductase domain-containing protein [Spirochaetales bacterium]
MQEKKIVFLTGSTGFIGAYVLHELLVQTEACVFCLVREHNNVKGLPRIKENMKKYALWDREFEKRIVPVNGDLSKPMFGMSETEFGRLGGSVDSIYHCGAHVNHVFPYLQLKAPNVSGTQEIIRLAVTSRLKPVHYTSILGTIRGQWESERRLTESISPGKQPVANTGYGQSKWVAEKLLYEARERGVPVSIYRLVEVFGDSRTGIVPDKDLFWWVIKTCVKESAVPDVSLYFNITPVDYVSKALVYISLQEQYTGKNFHLVNSTFSSWRDFYNYIDQFGFPVKLLTYRQWHAMLLSKIETSGNDMLFPIIFRFPDPDSYEKSGGESYEDMPVLEQENTRGALKDARIQCPRVDFTAMSRYFSFCIEKGILEKPSIFLSIPAAVKQTTG